MTKRRRQSTSSDGIIKVKREEEIACADETKVEDATGLTIEARKTRA